MALFHEDPKGRLRKNNTTMPARNYAIITQNTGLEAAQQSNTHAHANGGPDLGDHQDMIIAKDEKGGPREQKISAAAPGGGTTRPFPLEIDFRVEIDSKDPEGKTKGYGFSIPGLDA